MASNHQEPMTANDQQLGTDGIDPPHLYLSCVQVCV
jgi:hypothetical protein